MRLVRWDPTIVALLAVVSGAAIRGNAGTAISLVGALTLYIFSLVLGIQTVQGRFRSY